MLTMKTEFSSQKLPGMVSTARESDAEKERNGRWSGQDKIR